MLSEDWVLAIKKTLSHPKSNYLERFTFLCKLIRYKLQGRTIIFLDESGFALDSPRTHGYTKTGERCYAKKDWHAKGRVNVIGAIIEFTFLTVCLFDCNINSDVFYAWLTQDLLPKAPPKAVIVLDNATFHKRKDIIDAIQAAGHTDLFLPPYSPDLNPIEHKWAEVKAKRRKEKCNVTDLFLSNTMPYYN
jgi:transposase